MEQSDQAPQPSSPRANESAANPPPDQSVAVDGALVGHPAAHRYEIAYLLSLRSLPASQKAPEGSSQLNSAMRWANNNRRSETGFKPPVRSGRFGSDELQQGNAQPLLSYQSESGQGSLLGMPAHLRPNAQQKKANAGSRKPPGEPSFMPTDAPAEPAPVEQPEGEEDPEARFRRPTTNLGEGLFGSEAANFLPQASKFVDEDLKQIGKSQLGLHPAGFQWASGDQRPGQSISTTGANPSRVNQPPAVNATGGAFGGYVPPPRMMDMGPRSGFDRPMVGMDAQYYATAPEGSQWEHDPWDSPVDQGDVNDIFTLGDIRQAEHTIETQGISAESYANFRTRKIMNDQADRRRPPTGPGADSSSVFAPSNKGMSPDIFFGDGRPPALGGDRAPPGESRFLSMFNENTQTAGHDQRAPTPRTLTATREQLQSQAISVLQNLPYHQQQQLAANWMAQQTENKSAGERAQMREHLLKLLGLTKPHGQGEIPPQAEQVYKQYQANVPAPRPPGMTFSKPLNPAAPNFAPSGLYNAAVGNEHMKRGNGSGVPQPQAPMDYRRGQMGFEHSPSHHPQQQQAHYPPGWNPRIQHPHSPPMDEYGNQMGNHQGPPMGGAASNPDIQELIQKLLARKMASQHQASDQHLAAAQLQRSLSAAGNLTQEQVQNVLNFLRNSKQFTMSQGPGVNPGAPPRRNPGGSMQQKAENMMGQQGGGQGVRPNYQAGPAPAAGAGNSGPITSQLSQAALAQLLNNNNLLQQINASPHGNRGGARNEPNKAMAALLQTLTKATGQPRAGTPGAPTTIPTAQGGTGSKHIQLSNCLDQLQNNPALQNAMKKQQAAAAAAAAQRGNYPPPPHRPRQGHPPPPPGGFGMEHDPASQLATKSEQQAAIANLLRSLPQNHQIYSHLHQLFRNREQQERERQEVVVNGAPSTTSSSNNGATTAPPTTTTSTTGPHTTNSCENKENGGGSEIATTENCSSPPTAAPPAKDEVVGEQNEHNSPRQVSAAEE